MLIGGHERPVQLQMVVVDEFARHFGVNIEQSVADDEQNARQVAPVVVADWSRNNGHLLCVAMRGK